VNGYEFGSTFNRHALQTKYFIGLFVCGCVRRGGRFLALLRDN
jgi:hypothetical protein